MSAKQVLPARIFTIRRRRDGRFVPQSDVPGASPLGVDSSLEQALGSARREATLASRAAQCRIIIKTENAQGKMEQVDVVEPPAARKAPPFRTRLEQMNGDGEVRLCTDDPATMKRAAMAEKKDQTFVYWTGREEKSVTGLVRGRRRDGAGMHFSVVPEVLGERAV